MTDWRERLKLLDFFRGQIDSLTLIGFIEEVEREAYIRGEIKGNADGAFDAQDL